MEDVISNIFINLQIESTCKCLQVNSAFYEAGKNESLWNKHYLDNYNGYDIVGNFYETCKKYYCMSNFSKIINKKLKYYDTHYDKYYKIRVTLPNNPKELSNINIMNLAKLRIKIIPTELFLLHNLEYLNLNENKIKIIPNEIFLLHNLKTLKLYHNKIVEIPYELLLLVELQKLCLQDNLIKVIPTEISLLQNLQILNMENNVIRSIPIEMGKLQNLRYLNLSINIIKTIPTELAQLKQLKVIELRDNPIKIPAEFFNTNIDIYAYQTIGQTYFPWCMQYMVKKYRFA